MTYYFEDWFAIVNELQSAINIFSDAGPGVRWVGNEQGFAGNTSWSTINQTLLSISVKFIFSKLQLKYNFIFLNIIVCASCIYKIMWLSVYTRLCKMKRCHQKTGLNWLYIYIHVNYPFMKNKKIHVKMSIILDNDFHQVQNFKKKKEDFQKL